MLIIPVAVYVLLCLLVAFRGRYTPLGYLGTFLLSVSITPILVFVGLVLLTHHPADEGKLAGRSAAPSP